jgi:hypothetical protein
MFITSKNRSTLYCFSPPVMIATFVIEIVLALYTLWKYRTTRLAQLVATTLAFLALFQLSEYMVCGDTDALQWSRIGFAAITMLPPLGLHILHMLAKRRSKLLPTLAYATAIGFIGYFLAYKQAFSGHICTGNYVIFQLSQPATILYSLFYFGWLVLALLCGITWSRTVRTMSERRAIWSLLVGYLVFLVPTGIAAALNPTLLSGIPSIMCGFAVLFALVIALYTVPTALSAKK